ncbi:MAG: hypothetical protein AAFO06_02395 [Cyanobacteria bacterium J06597_16]
MIPPIYQSYIEQQVSARQSLLLSLLITVLHTIHDVRLETIAEALPLPILFKSRREKFNGSLRWGHGCKSFVARAVRFFCEETVSVS